MSNTEDDLHDLSTFKHPARVLIINHENFEEDDTPTRTGTSEDVKALKGTFQDIGINEVEVIEDQNLDDIEAKINEYALKKDYTDYGCLFIFVLTHGGSGGILCAYDEGYHESHLWTPIIHSEKLKGVPKIFITQACRTDIPSSYEIRLQVGETYDKSVSANTAAPSTSKFRSHITTSMEEVIYVYSTLEERSSMRIKDYGSWFITELSIALRDLNKRTLHSILATVNENMVHRHFTRKEIQCTSINDSTNRQDQTMQPSQANNERHVSEIGVQNTETPINKTSQKSEPQFEKCIYGQTSHYVSYLSKDIKLPAVVPLATCQIKPQEKSTASDHLENPISSGTAEDGVFASVNIPEQQESQLSRLESDAGGKIVDLDEESTYKKCTYQGRMYILHDANHSTAAEELSKVAKNLLLCDISLPISSKQECYDILNRVVSKTDEFKEESLLFVAILTSFDDEKHFTEELKKFKEPFLATQCSSLNDKPKIFMFIDLQMEAVSQNQLEGDGEHEHQYVTENSDFLIIRGFGSKYMSILFEKLKFAKGDSRGLIRVILDAKRKFKTVSAKDAPIKQPHIDFTLRKKIMIYSDVEILPMTKVTKREGIKLNLKDAKDFEGRRRQLDMLKEYLQTQNNDFNTQVIHGEVGIGKTYIMLQFITEIKDQFENIIILDCSSKETLENSLKHLEKKINDNTKLDSIEGMYAYINKYIPEKSLFIFDNVNDDFDDLKLQQKNPNFYNIIITRSNKYIGKYTLLEVPKLEKEDAEKYIKKICENKDASLSDTEVTRIAELCGYIPLNIYLLCTHVNEKLTQPMGDPELSDILENLDEDDDEDYYENTFKECINEYNISISGIKVRLQAIIDGEYRLEEAIE